MVTRKTQYGWMAMGGLLCLFGLGLTLKLRDGNRAIAQAAKDDIPSFAPLKEPPLSEPKKSDAKKSDKPSSAPANLDKGKKKYTPFDEVPPPPPSVTLSGATTGFPLETGETKKAAPKTSSKGTDKPLPPPDLGSGSAPPVDHSSLPPTVTDMPSPPPPPLETKPTSAPRKTTSYPVSPPAWNAPGAPLSTSETRQASTRAPEPAEPHPMPGEPPLAPAPGPVQMYQVHGSETLRDIARRTLGSSERWADIHKLNPTLQPEVTLAAGTTLRLPGDACVQEDSEGVRPLPSMRAKAATPKAKKLLPLTGTFPCNLDDNKAMTLPKSIREQLGGASTVLVTPGPDKCLWLTNQAHLDRMAERLEHSPAREVDVRVFKRLYFAQTEKAGVNAEGRVTLPERLAQFAGLQQEVVLVGIDDHFEVWDAARWRQYTQQKGGAGSTEASEQD